MSEKIYALLLRLYPASFRRRYHDEALQLLRDRLRDEQGFFRRLRLWVDLLADLVCSLPMAYRQRDPYAFAAADVAPIPDGIPAFRTLEEEPLKPQSIFLGSILGIAGLAVFAFLMTLTGPYHPFADSSARLNAAPNGPEQNADGQIAAAKRQKQIQAAAQRQSCGFERAGLLPGNLAYVQIAWFADPAACGATAREILTGFGSGRAIIVDLRTCGAADPEMAVDFAQWVPNRPIYVLTSANTSPGAASFTTTLKKLRITTIIGEQSRLAAAMRARTENPAHGTSGIVPDMQVTTDALEEAESLSR